MSDPICVSCGEPMPGARVPEGMLGKHRDGMCIVLLRERRDQLTAERDEANEHAKDMEDCAAQWREDYTKAQAERDQAQRFVRDLEALNRRKDEDIDAMKEALDAQAREIEGLRLDVALARGEAAALRSALEPFAYWVEELAGNDPPSLGIEHFRKAAEALNNPGAGREYAERVRVLENFYHGFMYYYEGEPTQYTVEAARVFTEVKEAARKVMQNTEAGG